MTRASVRNRQRRLGCSFSDPNISVGAVAESFQGGLVGLAVMRFEGLFDGVEFDDHDALHKPGLIGFGGTAANQESAAVGLNGGPASFAYASIAAGSEIERYV